MDYLLTDEQKMMKEMVSKIRQGRENRPRWPGNTRKKGGFPRRNREKRQVNWV